MRDRESRPGTGERGFALVLAILSLMLLTFLGLTLATTTSTELQIATNYRWSQQALYNAEAGLEVAKIVLSRVADPSLGWDNTLPAVRNSPATWTEGGAPTPAESPTGRDFHLQGCDTRGGMGYGLVLDDGATRYEDVSAFMGETLNGAFTIWVRRGLVEDNTGQYSDDDDPNNLVIVAEGVAPYSGPDTAFTRARQAVRVLETRFALALDPGNPCVGNLAGQEGLSSTGENFNPCALAVDGADGSLAIAFGGGAGAGSLGSQTTAGGAVVR